MNDIDILERLRQRRRSLELLKMDGTAVLMSEAADAIETGRQWETIARRLAHDLAQYSYDPNWPERYPDSLAAFRDLADRTPTPTDGP